jgi:hypothetical protein
MFINLLQSWQVDQTFCDPTGTRKSSATEPSFDLDPRPKDTVDANAD